MHIFRPAKDHSLQVILVHSGGWTPGSKTANFVVPLFEPLTKTGYTWFTIDYRLAPQHPHPAAVEDVESVIVFVKKHAREYKVNPKRIALMGESAGGHLANLVGARNKPSANVAAVVSFYGPIDMVKFSKRLQDKPPSDGMKSFFEIKQWDAAAMAKLREASPSTYLGHQTPPFLFIQGTADTAVPYEQATLAVRALQERSHSVRADYRAGGCSRCHQPGKRSEIPGLQERDDHLAV